MHPFEVQPQRTIAPILSIYLDLVRFLAAAFVVLYHSWKLFYPDSYIKWPGHEAVVVFFVLSGYVISHAASRPGMTFAVYCQHRLARIVPVAWMALLIGLLLTLYAPSLNNGANPSWPTLANLLFIAQSGFWSIEAPLNPPFWSLNYEVWYYLIFAVWLYAPRKWRAAATAFALLAAGPKVLLLFPVWLMGVWLCARMPALGRGAAMLLFAATLTAAFALCWLDVSDMLRSWLYHVFPPAWRANYSTQFLYDILLGMVVAANFAAVAALGPAFSALVRLEQPIRYAASFTFSLYVFHSPLIELLYKLTEIRSAPAFYALMAFGVFVLAQLTERRVRFFRVVLETLFLRAGSRKRATT